MLGHIGDTVRGRLQAILIERGGALAVVALAFYVAVAPAHIVDGDNAELATLGAVGGRAHPSGYPLYVLYLRATSWLPLGSAAHRAAIATALLGALAVLVLHAACRAWGARPIAATLAAAMFGAAPVIVRMHTEAEVFALNELVVATVLWLAAQARFTGVTRAALLGGVAGLGLANHMTCALVAPVGLYGIWCAWREARGWRVPAAALGALALGLAPYAYLAIAPEPASFGRVDSLGDLVAIVLRSDYGGPGAFVPHGPGSDAGDNLLAFAHTLARSWLVLPLVLGLATLAVRCVRGERRVLWAALAVSWLVAGPLLIARFNIPPHGLGLYVCERFHILPLLLLAIPVAVGIEDVLRRLHRSGAGLAANLGALAMFAALAVGALRSVGPVHTVAMENGVRNLLASLPDRAVVIATSEDQCFGVRYLQLTEAVRPDVTFACATLLTRAWYRERLGVAFAAQPGPETSAEQAERLLARGPLLVDDAQRTILAALPSYPLGILRRVLPRNERPPPPADILAANLALYDAFLLDEPPPTVDDDYAAIAHYRYAATWRALGRMLDAAGMPRDAQTARDLEHQLEPSR